MAGAVMSQLSNMYRRGGLERDHNHSMIWECLPLPQAAEIELAAMPPKTPVTILQELLQRRGIALPEYHLVQVEGEKHELIFRYRVNVNGLIAMGRGLSKREAKQAAAKSLLDILIKNKDMDGFFKEGVVIANEETVQEEPIHTDDNASKNPINWLQEMCVSRHWPLPLYKMENEEGLSHERQFTFSCDILNYREFGTGKSKKLAKWQAAHKMWQHLQDTPMEGQGLADDDEKTCLNNEDLNVVQLLEEIASEQQLQVTYGDIEEKSLHGKFQCIVQLSTLAVTFCYGSGTTTEDAQANAAQKALERLKAMTE